MHIIVKSRQKETSTTHLQCMASRLAKNRNYPTALHVRLLSHVLFSRRECRESTNASARKEDYVTLVVQKEMNKKRNEADCLFR